MMNNNGNFDFYDFIIPIFMLLGCTIGILIGVFLFPLEYMIYFISFFSVLGYLLALLCIYINKFR